jgi:hypothetical protein
LKIVITKIINKLWENKKQEIIDKLTNDIFNNNCIDYDIKGINNEQYGVTIASNNNPDNKISLVSPETTRRNTLINNFKNCLFRKRRSITQLFQRIINVNKNTRTFYSR